MNWTGFLLLIHNAPQLNLIFYTLLYYHNHTNARQQLYSYHNSDTTQTERHTTTTQQATYLIGHQRSNRSADFVVPLLVTDGSKLNEDKPRRNTDLGELG